MSNTVITVANAAELMSALAGATGGETIRLQAGNYGDLSALERTRHVRQQLHQCGHDHVRQPETIWRVFTSMQLTGVKNLSFDSVKFDYTATAGDSGLGETIHYRKLHRHHHCQLCLRRCPRLHLQHDRHRHRLWPLRL